MCRGYTGLKNPTFLLILHILIHLNQFYHFFFFFFAPGVKTFYLAFLKYCISQMEGNGNSEIFLMGPGAHVELWWFPLKKHTLGRGGDALLHPPRGSGSSAPQASLLLEPGTYLHAVPLHRPSQGVHSLPANQDAQVNEQHAPDDHEQLLVLDDLQSEGRGRSDQRWGGGVPNSSWGAGSGENLKIPLDAPWPAGSIQPSSFAWHSRSFMSLLVRAPNTLVYLVKSADSQALALLWFSPQAFVGAGSLSEILYYFYLANC